MKYDYSFDEILTNLKKVLLKNFPMIFIIFIIEVGLIITFNVSYHEQILALSNSNQKNLWDNFKFYFELKALVLQGLMLIVSVIAIGLFIKYTYNTVLDENKKFTFKNYFNYIITSIFLYMSVFVIALVFFMVLFIFAFIPIIGIVFVFLGVIGFICLLFYFLGLYRFVPYIAFFEGLDNLFTKSKKYINRHLALSIIVLIINGLLDRGITAIVNGINSHNYLSYSMNIVTQLVVYLFLLFDLSFIVTGYKRDVINKQLIKEEKERRERELLESQSIELEE